LFCSFAEISSLHQRACAQTYPSCTRAHIRRLHQNGSVPEILPNLFLVRFVSF
jgi:hypothetical protein